MDITTNNPICAGITPQENGIIEFKAGETYNFDISCGERDLNAPGCLIGDWHSGNNLDDYSGCALSVNYGDYKNMNEYYYISYSKDCAKRGEATSFKIANNIKNCDKCICSWSWAPSRMYSSPGQFYHNCFYCSISGGTNSSSTMRNLDFINIKNTNNIDTTYNDINPGNIYISQASSSQSPSNLTSITQAPSQSSSSQSPSNLTSTTQAPSQTPSTISSSSTTQTPSTTSSTSTTQTPSRTSSSSTTQTPSRTSSRKTQNKINTVSKKSPTKTKSILKPTVPKNINITLVKDCDD